MDRTQGIVGIGPGARIAVPGGLTPVEWLEPGQQVRCRDRGNQRLLAVLHVSFGPADLMQRPEASPVCLRAGALGRHLPLHDVILAPDQRLLRPAPRRGDLPGPIAAAQTGLPAPEGRADYTLLGLAVPDMLLVEGVWMPSATLSALRAVADRAA